MFLWKKSETHLDREIERAIAELDSHPVMSEEYGAVLDRIGRLNKMKEAGKPPRQISPDTVIIAATNLIGIIMIIRHENVNVITSKAMGHVMKTPVR